MRILWFTPTPSLAINLINKNNFSGGWIEALQAEIMKETSIELAIKPVNELKIINSLSEYENKIFKIFIPRHDRQFKYILKSIFPNIYHGFFDKNLYLIIQKD